MISAVAFLKKGVAQATPERYEMSEEEYQKIMEKAEQEIRQAKENIVKTENNHCEHGKDNEMEKDPELAIYNLDTYDDDDNDDEIDDSVDMEVDDGKVDDSEVDGKVDHLEKSEFGRDIGAGGLFANIKGLAYHIGANDEDPYITLKEDEEEKREEQEDLQILPSDYLIVSAKTEDDISHIEISVYEEEQDNLYVHHDIMLPSFPLCVEWIGHHFNVPERAFGNFLAVGTFDPEIEIWNLDMLDCIYPKVILGSSNGDSKASKAKLSSSRSSKCHTDAVMTLAWNRNHGNVLASGSADKSIKLWDLNSGILDECVASFDRIHKDKVQSIQWNPNQSTMLLSGSYDKTVALFDSSNSNEGNNLLRWKVSADVESVKWNPFDSNYFLVSLEDGNVLYYDIRGGNGAKPIFTLNAHSDKAVTCIDWNPVLPGIFLTGSTDKSIKLWSLGEDGQTPSCMHSSCDINAGKIFSASFSKDSPYLVCAGGSKASLKIWNVTENRSVRDLFTAKIEKLK